MSGDPRCSLDVLEAFFADLAGERFPADPERAASARRDAAAALGDLLVWGRPLLETTRGLAWPYARLRESSARLERIARTSGEPARQADLTLALLPFPGQWRRLARLERTRSGGPEVARFLALERARLRDKLAGKGEDRFKLRHFLQVLKPPPAGRNGKGVLRVFAMPWLLLAPALLSRIAARYALYVEPPMGVVCRHAWWRPFAGLDTPVLFGCGGPEDRAWLATQDVETSALAHGDFLPDLPGVPEPPESGGERYDLVFNSTFAEMDRKRHNLMLDLLARPGLAGTTALFLGRDGDGGAARLAREAEARGLGGPQGRVRIIAGLKRADVPALLARCGVGVHLSLYENAPRCVYEFLRADLPCVASACMAGLNPDVVNPRTGILAPDAGLEAAVRRALDGHRGFSPRRWFQEHSGSARSTRRLSDLLGELFLRRGLPWEGDIVPLTSGGASRYGRPEEYRAFRAEYEWLMEGFLGLGARSVGLSVEDGR